MNDADKFLDQIIESPEDHTLRLVYADWLDDHAQNTAPCDVCPGTGFISERDYVGFEQKERYAQWAGMYDAPHRRFFCKRCGESGKLDGPDGRLDAAAFWRAQVHFPYEVETTVEQFLAVAEFLALFPQLKWVGLTDYPRLDGSRHPLIERVWSPRLTEMLHQISFRGWACHPQEGRNALSVSCLEYVWALRPTCELCPTLGGAINRSLAQFVALSADGGRSFRCDYHLNAPDALIRLPRETP